MSKAANQKYLSDEALEIIASRFLALGDVSRLKILQVLHDGKRSVTELAERTGLSQSNVSRHLQRLCQSGIVSRKRSGVQIFAEISDQSVFQICDKVCGSVQKLMKERQLSFEHQASFGTASGRH